MTESKRFCPNCGARVEPGDAFCASCGAKLATGAPNVVSGGDTGKVATDRKLARKNRIVTVFIVCLLVAFVFSMLNEARNRPVKSYADAAERALGQLEQHADQVELTFDIPGFTEELTKYPVSEIGAGVMTEDVMYRLYRQALRWNGNPRLGDRLALTSYPSNFNYRLNGSRGNYSTFRLVLTMRYFTTKAQEDALEERVKTVLAGMNLSGKSDYEKAKSVYNYICANVTYDYAHLPDDDYLPQYTAYAAMFDHTAVCSGVAELFYVMATAAGLEVHIKTSSDHAWNYVKVDGTYYYLDATWDLGVPEANYQYFLKGKSDFVLKAIPHK